MQALDGIVTIVQEGRFMLQTGGGEHHLFVLGHNASLEPAQLAPLQRAQARVLVRFTAAPGLIALLAHSVALLDQNETVPA